MRGLNEDNDLLAAKVERKRLKAFMMKYTYMYAHMKVVVMHFPACISLQSATGQSGGYWRAHLSTKTVSEGSYSKVSGTCVHIMYIHHVISES